MFIIIKTICNDKNNVESELISVEKGFIYNTISHIYQLLEIQDL